MTSRKQEWVAFAGRKLGALDPLEEALANAAANVLASTLPGQLDMPSLTEHDRKCAATLVAIVELARAVARGDFKTFKVVKA